MKKIICIFTVCAIVIAAVIAAGCKKSNPAAADTAVPTATLTITPNWSQTVTLTMTCTLTSTNTPVILIDATLYDSTSGYQQVFVYANLTPVSNAAVTVNGTPVPYDAGSGSYMNSLHTIAGTLYTVSVHTNGTVYSNSGTAPGSNVALNGAMPNYTVTWGNEGNQDVILVRNSASTLTYRSADTLLDIDSGFAIPGTAFPASDSYSISVYTVFHLANAFLPAQGDFYIERETPFNVTKP